MIDIKGVVFGKDDSTFALLNPAFATTEGFIFINKASHHWRGIPDDELPLTIIEVICHEEIEVLSAGENLSTCVHFAAKRMMDWIGRETTSLLNVHIE